MSVQSKQKKVVIFSKHNHESKDKRIRETDLYAVAKFIELSHGVHIRFWIETKLPETEEGSFERWLRRGVSPYTKCVTLIFSSAQECEHRFWIAK